MSIYRLSETCSVGSQILVDDVASLATDGFVTIICNRPDGEDLDQPLAKAIATECEQHNIAFHFIPVHRSGLTMDMVENFGEAVASSTGQVLAYCRSGQRSSVLWQASGSP